MLKSAITRLMLIALMVPVHAAAQNEAEPRVPRAPAIDPATVLEDIKSAVLDVDGARPLRDLRLNTGFADLYLAEGFLFPSRTRQGHVVEMVYIGRGTLALQPEDPGEAAQLELFTGAEVLDEDFTEAVLMIASDAATEALLDRPRQAAPPEMVEKARARYAGWRQSQLRGLLDIEAASALDRLGDRLYRGHFAGYFLGENLGELLVGVQPEAAEQLTLGRFEKLELEGRERRRAERQISRLHRKGRFLGLEVDELGTFDTWVSMPLRAPAGEIIPGFAAFEPSHYDLRATLDPADEHLRVAARLKLVPQIEGVLSVGLELPADLLIDEILDGASGQPLTFHRVKSQIRVFLSEPSRDPIELEIRYHGKGLIGEGRAWLPIDNFGWYPRVGTLDRATYDLELTWPKKHDLFASGTLVDEGVRGNQRWQKRSVETPVLAVSFTLGRYKTQKLTAGGVDITLAIDNSLSRGSRQDGREIGEAVTSALVYFEKIFGDYAGDQLTVVTVPTGLSQSLPGFIQLSNLAMEDDWIFQLLLGLEDRRTVIAHELAHQWWGNSVGWKTYRDQWISEAMANYSALLWARRGAPADIALGFGPTAGWRSALSRRLTDGRRLESVGPLVLGERLNSSLAEGYFDIVYKKGAVVVDMLAGFWGEEKFIEILGRVTRAAAGHVISTEDFFALLEKATGSDLDAFAQRFVYSTGLPDIYYDYRFEDLGDGRYRIHLEAEQEVPYRFRYSIVEGPNGLDVTRERIDQTSDQTAPMVVPFLVEIEVPGADDDRLHLLNGRLSLSEPETSLEMEIEHKPVAVQLDAASQVFGRFYDRRSEPKRIDYWRAIGVAAAGDRAEARRLFEEVLDVQTPIPEDAERAERKEAEEQDRVTDWLTHLQLVRLDLREGDLQSAADGLERASKLMPKGSRSAKNTQRNFEARLALQRGDFRAAHKELRRVIRKQRRQADVETWLLMAVAAYQAGDQEDAREALEKVEETGADVAVLTAKLNVSGR